MNTVQENNVQTDFVVKLLEAVINYKNSTEFGQKPITTNNQQICTGITSEIRQQEMKFSAEEVSGQQPQPAGKNQQGYVELDSKKIRCTKRQKREARQRPRCSRRSVRCNSCRNCC